MASYARVKVQGLDDVYIHESFGLGVGKIGTTAADSGPMEVLGVNLLQLVIVTKKLNKYKATKN